MVTIEISPSFDSLIAWLRQVETRKHNLRGAWPFVEKQFRVETKAQFAGEGTSPGTGLARWAPLSMVYRLWKEENYPGKPILELTGALKRAFATGRGGSITRTAMTWEFAPGIKTDSGYDLAKLHHTGTSRMPSRPPFRIPNEIGERMVARPVMDYICGKTGPALTKKFPAKVVGA